MSIRPVPRPLVASMLALGVITAVAAMAPPPAAAIPGLVEVSEMSEVDSSATKSVFVQCPPGTTVIGGGGFVGDNAAKGEVFLRGMRPVVTFFGTGYQVFGTEDQTGTGQDWHMEVRAICAPAPPGLQYVWDSSPASSNSWQVAVAACPAGKKVLGTGAMINGGTGQVGLQYVLPTPDPPSQVVVRGHEDDTGFSGLWSLTSWAVCADPPRGLERVHTTDGHLLSPEYAQTECPGSKRAHGVGAQVIGDPADVRLAGAAPNFLLGGGASASADETGTSGRWSLTAIAICA